MIIIDDEIWAQRGLSEIIAWESLGYEKCGCFDDPQKAFEHILSDPPDVVFTDIRMPGMSGLELLEKCRQSNENIIFVIVSAYSDFKYAQKALENGAFGYIVKPLEVEQVTDIAGRIAKNLKKRAKSELNDDLRDYLVYSLLHNNNIQPKPSIRNLLNTAGEYRVIIEKKAAATYDQYVSDENIFRLSDNGWLHIVPAEYCISNTGFFHVGESSPGTTDEDLPRLIREGVEALYTAEFLDFPVLQYIDNASESFERSAAAIYDFIRVKDPLGTGESLEQIKKIILKDKVMLSRIVGFYNQFLSELQKHCAEEDFRNMLEPFSDYFQMFGIMRNAEFLFERMRVLLNVLEPEQDRENLVRNEVVREIVAYVDENFAEGITLEQISLDFHMSISHISRQFKRLTGMTYSNYISARKVEKAKTLLVNSSDTIAEIGRNSGYSDYFYFLRSFKKATGLSPTQYKKRYGAG